MADFKIPGGDHKGAPLAQAPMVTLTYWAERIGNNINKNESQNPTRDKALHQALCSEIARREGGGKQEQKAPAGAANTQGSAAPAQGASNTQIVARKPDELAGSYSKPADATQMMRNAQAVGHLVTPQTACPELPQGCVIATSLVWIDPDTETYGIPHKDSSKRGLDKTALAKISAAAGIDWDSVLCGRLDNGRDPHYVHYRAVGHVRNFDGTPRTEVGQVEQDLRDGSDEASGCTDKELPIRRKFILRHAESKAMNRVIRRLGVRTSYERSELTRPFIIVKIMFTGQTDDPKLREMFASKIADKFLGGHQQLYPGARHATPGLPSHTMQHEPPPVGESAQDDDDFSDYPDEPQLPQTTQGSAAVDVPAQQRQGDPVPQGATPKQADMKY